MVKTLTKHGNSYALVIDRAILELLQMDPERPVELTTDGNALTIRPMTEGTKGARVTSHISIPGRHLVFMPTVDHVGISRRIGNEKERRRLREIVDRLRPPGTGFIVRTVAEAHGICDRIEAALKAEVEGAVITIHVEPEEKAKQQGVPVL